MGKKSIVISYSRSDLAFVSQLADALRREGHSVWFDTPLQSGTEGENTKARQIGKGDILIVVLSDTSVGSSEVMEEVALAIRLEKMILPIRIANCELPEQLAHLQVWDFRNSAHWSLDIEQLLSSFNLKRNVDHDRPVSVTAPRPKATKKSKLPKAKRSVTDVIGGLFGKFRGIIGKGTVGEASSSETVFEEGKVQPGLGERAGVEFEGLEETGVSGGSVGGQDNAASSKMPNKGVLAHSIPTKMQLRNTHRCIIRIGFDEVTIIKDFPERNREVVVKKDIRVSDVMEVEFLPNPHFEITALNNIKQPVDAYEYTEWNFDVMPKTMGEFPLTFKISIFLPNGSKEMILRETVSVITQAVPSGEVFIPSELMTLGEYYKTLNKKLKIVTLFLASSSELADDRRAFEILIGRKNKNLIKENYYLELIIWEDFMDAMSASRLQDEYNKAIAGCDVFISLFYTKAGKYTEEEFLKALDAFKMNKRPLIYTYFKDTDVKETSLIDFQQRLSDLGHFYTRFKDADDLNYKFGEQIEKFLPLIK